MSVVVALGISIRVGCVGEGQQGSGDGFLDAFDAPLHWQCPFTRATIVQDEDCNRVRCVGPQTLESLDSGVIVTVRIEVLKPLIAVRNAISMWDVCCCSSISLPQQLVQSIADVLQRCSPCPS